MFRFFKQLQSQLLALLFVSIILPIVILGGYGFSASTSAISELAISNLNSQVFQNATEIENFLVKIKGELVFLSKVPPIQGIIQAKQKNDTNEYRAWVDRLNKIFQIAIDVEPSFQKLRYLDEAGQELVRVDFDGNRIEIATEQTFENGAQEAYFIETMEMSAGDIYISPIQLKREAGKLEEPYIPIVRYAVPIFDGKGDRKGVVMASIFADRFIRLAKNEKLAAETETLLVDENGYYLMHPNPDKEWGADLETNWNLKNDYSLKVVDRLLIDDLGYLTQGQKSFISYQKLLLDVTKNKFLVLIYRVPKSIVFARVNRFKRIAISLTIGSLAIAMLLGFLWVRRVVKSLAQVLEKIASVSVDLFSTCHTQESIASEQSYAVEKTTSEIEAVSTSSKQTARQAENVATQCQRAYDFVEDGDRALQATLNGMLTLQKKVAVISQQSQHLGEQTSEIGNISALARLVGDLAAQTNMLAINAAIEAVRAGEAGRGFTVVASEIRKLADRSRDAAEQINTSIPAIEKAISATVSATEEGARTLNDGLKEVREANQTFLGVRETADSVLTSSREISLNASRQAEAIDRIVAAMSHVNGGALQIVTGIAQTKEFVEGLNHQARHLQSML